MNIFKSKKSSEMLLYEAVEKNDCNKITKLIKENGDIKSSVYKDYQNMTILLIACSKMEGIERNTIKCLIDNGVDVSFSSKFTQHWTSFHHAISNNRLDIAELLLNKEPSLLNKCNYYGSNALHVAVKNTVKNHNEIEACKCVKFLIEKGINVNQLNQNNASPIEVAARNNFELVIGKILESSAEVNIDYTCKRSTTRQKILSKKLCQGKKLPEIREFVMDSELQPFYYLRNKDLENFYKCNNVIAKLEFETLLQTACRLNQKQVVEYLLQQGVDPFEISLKNEDPPIQIAAESSSLEIFKILLKYYKDKKEPLSYETIFELCHEKSNIKLLDCVINEYRTNHKYLIEVNKQNPDDFYSTIMHCLVCFADQENTRKLLKKCDASLVIPNDFGTMPIDNINPQLLENHLDDCLQYHYLRKASKFRLYDCKYHSFFLPKDFQYSGQNNLQFTQKSESVVYEIVPQSSNHVEENYLPETEAIFAVSKNSRLQHLLFHPIFLIFTYLKYKRLHKYLMANLIYHIIVPIILCSIMFWFKSNFLLIIFVIIPLALSQSLLIYILYTVNKREFMKIYCLLKIIFQIIFIILLIMLLFPMEKQISAITILFSVFQILLTPDFGGLTNLVILRKVLLNFFHLLIVFVFLIITFSVSFYLVFQPSRDNKIFGTNSTSSNSDKMNPFNSFWESIFTTFVMISGEFNVDSIDFTTLMSKIIFISFIFVIYIVLMNLLNGLAVTDVQDIKKDADLDCLKVRIKIVHTVEKFILSLGQGKLMKYRNSLYERFCFVPKDVKVKIEMYGKKNITVSSKTTKMLEKITDKTIRKKLKNHNFALFLSERQTENIDDKS